MPIRFQADADLNQIIVSAALRRDPAIDFRTATAARLAGLPDVEVLALAARDGRTVVTHDLATMARHFGQFVRAQRSPGVIVAGVNARVTIVEWERQRTGEPRDTWLPPGGWTPLLPCSVS